MTEIEMLKERRDVIGDCASLLLYMLEDSGGTLKKLDRGILGVWMDFWL